MSVKTREIEFYHGLGYDLVPLLDKRPIARWKDPIPIDEVVRLVRQRGADIGFVTGRSGIVVADGDSDEAVRFIEKELPATPQQARTSRGIHAFFRAPGTPVPLTHRFRGMALDILSGNSYARRREWLGEVLRPSELPEFPKGLVVVEKPKIIVPPVLDPDRERLVRRAELYIAKIEREEGQRDYALFKAACALVQRFGLSPDEAYPVLAAFNLTMQPPFPDARVHYKLSEALRLKGGKA